MSCLIVVLSCHPALFVGVCVILRLLLLEGVSLMLPIHPQDTDVRWDTIAGSVDDRTPAERGEVASEDVK